MRHASKGNIVGTIHVVTSPYMMPETMALLTALQAIEPPLLFCSEVVAAPDTSGEYVNAVLAHIFGPMGCDN